MTTTKLMKLPYSALLGLLLALIACSRMPIDPPQEDYDKLFPFQGAERPAPRYEEMIARLGNPETTPAPFVYPGVSIPGLQRSYDVTLTYTFAEPAGLSQGGGLNPQNQVDSHVLIRYVGADKQLHTLGSAKEFTGKARLINDGNPHELTFTLTTGQPLYLLVSGFATRGTTISASLHAISQDKIFSTPVLATRQTQNADEGEARLPSPYCQYIILP